MSTIKVFKDGTWEKVSGGSRVDLSGYATKDHVATEIAKAQLNGGDVDLSGYAKKSEVPTKTSDLTNDSGFITDYTETDPTVPSWAKQTNKPSYTKSEVGLDNVDNVKQYSASNPPPYPVTSVNGKNGAVTLDAVSVGARPNTWMPTAIDVGALPDTTVIPTVPVNVSAFTNDAGYLTQHQSLEGYALKSDIPTIEGLATEEYVDNAIIGINNIISPDKFSGTDSQKLQSAFDALSSSGGVISINRAYTLTANIDIGHDSSANNNLITVKGDGQNARIDFGAYCFQGADTTKRSYGGVIFKDLWLSGTDIGFNCTHLIRLTFDNCMIRNFRNFIYCEDCVQSVYIMGCYIRASSSGISNGMIKETVKTVELCDLKIIGCVAEQGYSLLNVSGLMDGCSITDCCIEGYHATPIVLSPKNRAVNISNNYFESNQGTHIDLTNATDWCAVSIYNNWFCEWNGMETIGAIFLPNGFTNGYLTIVGNQCPYANSILLHVPDKISDLSKMYAFANNGTTNDTTNSVKMLTPDDLNNVKVELVKGEDYWTTKDKEEMVNDVLAAMSGEEWIFTLKDGTTFKRTIATASLTEFNSEAWTFTLMDGSTVDKVVAII